MGIGASRVAIMGAAGSVTYAEGGTETDYDGYRSHTFLAGGDFVLLKDISVD